MSGLPMVTVSGPVLKWARTSIGIPLENAAERLKVSPAELAEHEQTRWVVRFTELEHLSTVYRRPIAAFLFATPPPEPPLPTDHRTVRTQSRFPLSTQTILAMRFAQRVQELAGDVAKLVGEELDVRLPSITLMDDPDIVARSARVMLGVSLEEQAKWRGAYDPLNGWAGAVEALGVYVLRQKMPWEETRGFAIPGMPPVIVLNSEDFPNGRVFSLMHELCHLMLSMSSVCDMRLSGYDTASQQVEVFCNRFAGALLVPEDSLRSITATRAENAAWTEGELRALARDFSVSQEVVLRRLLIIGKTSEDFYRAWRDRDDTKYVERRLNLNKSGWQPTAPKALQENGNRFTSQVLNAESSRVLSAAEAAQALSVGTRHLDKMRGLLS